MKRIMAPLGAFGIGVMLIVWSLVPVYHMVVMALTPANETFAGALWPAHPSLRNLETVLTQGHHLLRLFWRQMLNSTIVAVGVAALVLLIGVLSSFALARLKVPGRRAIGDVALLTYLIPAAFLTVPMYRTVAAYGLLDTLLSLILALTTFATPYAILVLSQAARQIPAEMDEAARIDGAGPVAMLLYIYIPLMLPSLLAIGTYAFLLAWNEYLYGLVLLAAPDRLTIPVSLGNLIASDDAPWNLLMATGLIYAVPPMALYYAVRRQMTEGLMAGAVKG